MSSQDEELLERFFNRIESFPEIVKFIVFIPALYILGFVTAMKMLWGGLEFSQKVFITTCYVLWIAGTTYLYVYTLEEEIANLREQIQQLEQTAQQTEPDVSEYGYTVDELQEQVNTFEADNDSKSNEISDLESQIRDMEFEINDLQNHLDDCENSR